MALDYAEYAKIDEFPYFLEEFGQPTKHSEVDLETLEKYRGILPNRLLTYWKNYGFCSFMDGLFWIVNPSDYEHIVQTWLSQDILDKEKLYVIARSGWGELYLWSPSQGDRYSIEVRDNWIFDGEHEFATELIEKGYEDKALEDFFTGKAPDRIDIGDSRSQPFFPQCIQEFGKLKENEIFVFVPPLFLGGESKIENVKKVDLFIHFDIQRQMYEPELIDIDGLFKKGWG